MNFDVFFFKCDGDHRDLHVRTHAFPTRRSSDLLRKRAQMKLKIRAMSSEAKASAYIVGSLPFFVFTIVWLMNPEYLAGFFTEPRLIVAGIGGMVWMGIGAFIMSRMISFEI